MSEQSSNPPEMSAAPVAAAKPYQQAKRALILFGVTGVFVAGFMIGRMGTGVRAEAVVESTQRARAEAIIAAVDSLPDAVKYEIFLQTAAEELPLGLTAKAFDANGNLVLYTTRAQEWQALQEVERRAIMGVIGASYTAFRLRNGMTQDLSSGHPVISLAAPDGSVLATRVESGDVVLYSPQAHQPMSLAETLAPGQGYGLGAARP